MSLSSVLTKAQQRVDDDNTALKNGSAAAADLPAAQAVLDAVNEVSNSSQGQSDAATARLAAAKASAATAATIATQVHDALVAAPFNLTSTQEKKLTKAVTDAGYATDFGNVQTALTTLATDSLTAADAQADLVASRQKVVARVKVLSQWLAVAETAIGQATPLIQLASVAVSANDLASAWWAMTQANNYLTVVNATGTSKAVTAAITDLKKQAEDYAAKLDASLAAAAAVAADVTALTGFQQALGTKSSATGAALTTLVSAGL